MADFSLELKLIKKGYQRIIGLDEVGRGCLAGPVVAGAVIFDGKNIPDGIRDSKELSAAQREKLSHEIQKSAVAYAVGTASVEEIDKINILNASKLAMVRAIEALSCSGDYLLIDGNFNIDYPLPQQKVVRGDQISVSIAAGAIIAKVYRDRLMSESDSAFPGYLFAKNKGYGSLDHRKALSQLGPCALHRKSFSWTPV